MKSEHGGASRREFLKGLTIGAGGCLLATGMIHPKDAIAQSVQQVLEKIPLESRWSIATRGLVNNEVSWANG